MEKRKYFDNKRWHNFNNEGSSGQKKIEAKINLEKPRERPERASTDVPHCEKNHSREC